MQESIDVHIIFAKYFSGCESLAYALSSKLGEGNICINIDEYKKELFLIKEKKMAKESLDEDDPLFLVSPEEFEKQCIPGKYVTYSVDELKPFVIRDRTAYLHRYFQYETQIINNIKRLGDNFYIITGGPGTGKTYSVALKLAELYRNNPGLRVALAAPTGKAGSRMNEAIKDFAGNPKNNIEQKIKDKLTGLKAHTIHVLLGYIPNSVFFRYDENNRLPYDVVIIDECSMIDGAMMAKLLNAIDTGTRLYLLGDKDQLASVEAGSVFGDMCRSKDSELMIGKVELKMKSWRFEADKGIGKFSTEVITGSFNNPENYAGDGQIIIDTSFSKELFDKYALLYKEYITEPDIRLALKKLNWIRFLCVTRENDQSVSQVNRQIQYLLSSRIPEFKPKYEGFYHNQPIIITQNDYKLGLFNGDTGIIRSKKTNDGEVLFAYFEAVEGRIKEIQAGYLNHFETVFAMTIHKSQGSEFNHVVVILPEKKGEKLLTRELLYTGVTRAKTNETPEGAGGELPLKSVLLQTSPEVLIRCVNKSVSRASGLEERLNNLIHPLK